MENKSGSGPRAGSLGGKGFYIVLFLCAAVIGLSVWIMFTEAGTNVEDAQMEQVMTDVTAQPAAAATVPPQQEAQETMAEQDTALQTQPPEEETDAAQTEMEEQPQVQSVFSETVTSYVWPVRGDVQTPYSIQTLLYDSTMADWRTHDGVDIACEQGTPVLATAAGLVLEVSSRDMLGTTVEIDHGNGTHSIYSNLAAQPPVSPGQEVAMGQVIGSVGSTALGEVNQVSHLHFAMTLDGSSADPMEYLPSDLAE